MTETNENKLWHYSDIVQVMRAVFPDMSIDEDNDGQLIIYTGVEYASSDGYCRPIKEGEESNG